jgi:competence protein ComEA
VVDVAGKVRKPGVYTLPAGSRVDDAVRAAGGPLAGVSLTSLNLASKVSDGEQIVVGIAGVAPISGGTPTSGAGGVGGSPTAAAPVNLNSATLEQLETLPGIGPALGQQILDWRSAHGRFTALTQLNDVPGIGDVRYAQLRPLVSL